MNKVLYKPPDKVRTARLRLRPTEAADAGGIHDAYARDPRVTRYMGWRPHEDLDETRAYLARCDAERAAGTDHAYVIEERSTGGLLGVIAAHRVCGGGAVAIGYGYVIRRDRWGEGFAGEALAAFVDHALAQPTVFRAFAVCDVENRASARVMEKAGMQREGVLRRYFVHPNLSPEPRDCLVYAKVR